MKATGAVALTAVAGGRPPSADRPRDDADQASSPRARGVDAVAPGVEPGAVRQGSRTRDRNAGGEAEGRRRHHESLIVDTFPLSVVDIRADVERIAVERTEYDARVVSFDPMGAGDLDPVDQRAALRGTSMVAAVRRDALVEPERPDAPPLSAAGIGRLLYEPRFELTGVLSDEKA
jgi:hypothetical protein